MCAEQKKYGIWRTFKSGFSKIDLKYNGMIYDHVSNAVQVLGRAKCKHIESLHLFVLAYCTELKGMLLSK